MDTLINKALNFENLKTQPDAPVREKKKGGAGKPPMLPPRGRATTGAADNSLGATNFEKKRASSAVP